MVARYVLGVTVAIWMLAFLLDHCLALYSSSPMQNVVVSGFRH